MFISFIFSANPLDTSNEDTSDSDNVSPTRIAKAEQKREKGRDDDEEDDLVEGLLTRSGDLIENEEDDFVGSKVKDEKSMQKETMSSSSGKYSVLFQLEKQLKEMKERKAQGGEGAEMKTSVGGEGRMDRRAADDVMTSVEEMRKTLTDQQEEMEVLKKQLEAQRKCVEWMLMDIWGSFVICVFHIYILVYFMYLWMCI